MKNLIFLIVFVVCFSSQVLSDTLTNSGLIATSVTVSGTVSANQLVLTSLTAPNGGVLFVSPNGTVTQNNIKFVWNNNLGRLTVSDNIKLGISVGAGANPALLYPGDGTGHALTIQSEDNSAAKRDVVKLFDSGILRIGSGVGLTTQALQYRGDGSGYKMSIQSINNTPAVARTIMTFDDQGRVGIGTTSPQFPLHVDTSVSGLVSSGTYGFLNEGGAGTISNQTRNISIKASQHVVGLEFDGISDKRIKTNFNPSNSDEDLNTLNQIQITNYQYKDKVQKGSGHYKKVIGQQVEAVYPIAVNKTPDAVPDVYKLADNVTFNAKTQTLKIFLANHNLKANEKVQLIFEKGKELKTVQKAGDNWFAVSHAQAENKVFVYGREVTDFRIVDYDAISMLNVSATQALAKQVKALQKRLDRLERTR